MKENLLLTAAFCQVDWHANFELLLVNFINF